MCLGSCAFKPQAFQLPLVGDASLCFGFLIEYYFIWQCQSDKLFEFEKTIPYIFPELEGRHIFLFRICNQHVNTGRYYLLTESEYM